MGRTWDVGGWVGFWTMTIVLLATMATGFDIAHATRLTHEQTLETYAMTIPVARHLLAKFCGTPPLHDAKQCQHYQKVLTEDTRAHAVLCKELAMPQGKYDCP